MKTTWVEVEPEISASLKIISETRNLEWEVKRRRAKMDLEGRREKAAKENKLFVELLFSYDCCIDL